jgi:hypothetical protein
MSIKKPLTDRDLATLRQRGLILTEETAFWQDGNLVAENLLNKSQRILDPGSTTMLESSRRVLKG